MYSDLLVLDQNRPVWTRVSEDGEHEGAGWRSVCWSSAGVSLILVLLHKLCVCLWVCYLVRTPCSEWAQNQDPVSPKADFGIRVRLYGKSIKIYIKKKKRQIKKQHKNENKTKKLNEKIK